MDMDVNTKANKDKNVNAKHNLKTRKGHKKKKRSRSKHKTSEILQGGVSIVKCNKIIVVKLQPAITKDSKHIICPYGKSIAIFRRKTGLLEKTFNEHDHEITNLYINEKDPSQIISCSLREFMVWDYTDLSLAKKYVFPFTASAWYINPTNYEDVYYKAVIQGETRKGGVKQSHKEQLIKFSITDPEKREILGQVSKNNKCVGISRSGDYVAYAYKNELRVYTHLDKEQRRQKFDDTMLTCVAFHPNAKELVVATGDKDGKIILWYNLFGKEKTLHTILHWHTLAVADLLFTNDGNYIMSGGKEGVLVIWQIETQHKSFVPRLGGAIHHLVQSSDDQYISVTLENNMIKVLSAVTSKLTKTIKYLAPAYELPAGLSYHSPTDCVVLNGRPDGVLQFYNPAEDIVKLSIDIIGENLVSSVKERYVYPTRVKHVAFSTDGDWMATVDEREDRILPTERKLKFWEYCEDTKNYILNTLVDPPHKGAINSLSFRPTESNDYMLVTTSEDGDIKTWALTIETRHNGSPVQTWQLHSIGSYGTNSCRDTCFSQDGSLLAVLFCTVTLWDPENLTFKRCLQYNTKDDRVKCISFAYHESSHFLIGYSDKYLIVWNVNDCSIAWMLEANVQLITCDPYSKYFAVFINPVQQTELTHLYMFDPISPSPATVCSNVKRQFSCISSAMFAPRKPRTCLSKSIWAQTGQLYILTESTEILAVSEMATEAAERVDGDEEMKENNETSAFEDIFGSLEGVTSGGTKDVDVGQSIPVGTPQSAVIRKMISTPANVLPCADVMCKVYIKSLLFSKPVPMDKEEMEIKKEEILNVDYKLDTGTSVNHNKNNESPESGEFTPSKALLQKLENLSLDFFTNPFQ